MRKLFIVITVVILLLVGFSTFINSTYFFNKYVAKNLKEYGFDYSKANGALLEGFNVENLQYKGRKLAQKVELKINIIKLINGVISINKLHLIDVNKRTLERVVDDFKPKDDNTTSSEKIDIDFEFNNILLTMKPFNLDSIKVYRAELNVDTISYKNEIFNIGNLSYNSSSSIADIFFTGKYKKRTLSIDNIDIKRLDVVRLVEILNSLKSDSNSNSDSELLTSPFTPNRISINSAKIDFKQFKLDGISTRDIKLKVENAYFDVKKLLLNSANLDFAYLGKELNLKFASSYRDRNLTIESLIVNVKNLNKLYQIYNHKYKDINSSNNSTNSSFLVAPIDNLILLKGKIKASNYKYKDEKLKYMHLSINNILYSLINNRVTCKKLNFNLDSTLLKLRLSGNLDKNIVLDSVDIYSNSIYKVINLIPDDNSSNSNSSMSNLLPNIFKVKNLKLEAHNGKFGKFELNEIYANGKDIIGKIDKFNIQKGLLNLKAKSPWGDVKLDGDIKNNFYYTKGFYRAKQRLLDDYSIPLIAQNIEPLKIDGKFGLDYLKIKLRLSGNNILKNINNLSLNSNNRVEYNYNSGDLNWKLDGNISLPQIKSAKIFNELEYIDKKDKLTYKGLLSNINLLLDDKRVNSLLENLKVDYSGDENRLIANAKAKQLLANFSTDFKSGNITLKNSKNINLASLVELPKKYENSYISNLNINSKINFNNILPISGNINLKSNLLNINGKWGYNNGLTSKLNCIIPKNSKIIEGVSSLKYSAIKEFITKINFSKNILNLELINKNIKSKLNYNLNSKDIKSNIEIGTLSLRGNGYIDNLNLSISTKSIKRAISSIKRVYKLDSSEDIDGDLNINLMVKNFKKVAFIINSPFVSYKSSGKRNKIKNVNIEGVYSNGTLNIDRYKLIYDEYNIYSNIPSLLYFNNSLIDINRFWVNDSLLIKGSYNLSTMYGKLKVDAKRFNINSDRADLSLYINSNIIIKKSKKYIKGVVKILKGKIKSAITRKNIADNEDIIILQRKRAKENTDFAKNIKLDLKIITKNGLIYSNTGSYFKLIPNIKIKKEYGKLSKFTGVVKITKDSYYLLNGKKLMVKRGLITFRGRSSSPNLNIELKYKGSDYTVYINISGTPTMPILFFRSNPPLTKEQILAYLLFDDTSAVGTHSEESMINMVGGSLAKSLLGSIGIKIDHISVKENGFSVGKSVSKNIIIYYNQDGEKASVKTKIDITKDIHSIIEIGKDKQSADIIFSKDY